MAMEWHGAPAEEPAAAAPADAFGGGGSGGGGGGAAYAGFGGMGTERFRDILAGPPIEWEFNMRHEVQEIIPGVFLSSNGATMRSKKKMLHDLGITSIVCVRAPIEARLVKAKYPDEFEYLVIDLADQEQQSIMEHYPRTRNFIDSVLSRGGRVLLHCNGGISQSGALMIAYIMEKFSMSYQDALTAVQCRRFCVSPLDSFQLQLKEFEHQVRARAQVQHMTPRRKPRAKRAFDEDDEDELEPRQNLWRPAADPGWMGMADAAANNGGSAGMDEAL